ncbi:hypothetical protein TL16_g04277 [Triparma laevis f. inornata]|uniref:VDE lipocalin domain-containing protein n=1 Tax=Triparma laevis f. inornata TaxID=1714386 RepID=A0A9W7A4Q8_9STRA|nr:hypothetical protein TL16_g04277 [Triparma laevis f. inornata]
MSSIIYLLLLLLLLPSADSWNLPFPRLSPTPKNLPPQTSLKVFAKKALATTTLIPLVLGFASPSFAGFEDYAKTSKMTADPICFITKCKAETTSLTPTSVKGLKCLGQCKGEQTCASQCFNKYTSPELESWLNCALERENCLPLPPSATENVPIKDLPPPMTGVDFKKMEGKWYKSYGKSDIYDMFPCQTNSFNVQIDNNQVSGLKADIRLRINDDTSGFYESSLTETLIPQSDNFLKVQGKMYGLTFNEKWSILYVDDDIAVVDYIGETLQGPYTGGFIYTRDKDSKTVAEKVEKIVDFKEYKKIDNTCPSEVKGRGGIVREKGGVGGGSGRI